MIPYFPEPILELGPVTVRPFPVLACLAIVAQFLIVMRRAPRFGFEEGRASTLLASAIFIGLVSAHVLEMLLYQPQTVAENPLVLLAIWGDLSSLGGMLGGILGTLVLLRIQGLTGEQQLRFVDCLLYALPFTLAIGRLGCGLQHDHRGLASSHWLAVDFPDTPRFDLGILEFFYASILALLFWVLGRRDWPNGFFIGLFFALYAPVRFAMDAFRIGEARYYGWTPGQYISLVAAALGLGFLGYVFARRRADVPADA